MIKVLIPIGDAAEAMDTLYPYYRLREDGFAAVAAGPAQRVYPLVMHEIPPGWDITREQPSYHLKADIAFSDEGRRSTAGYSSLAAALRSICGTTRTFSKLCVTSSRPINRFAWSATVLKLRRLPAPCRQATDDGRQMPA